MFRVSLFLVVTLAALLATSCATRAAARAPVSAAQTAGAHSPGSAAATRFDARLSGYDYPYDVQTYAFTAQGQSLEMAYMDVRPQTGANGRTVVLLHGKNFSGAYWSNTIAALVDQGYRVIAPDQIGFGKSSKPRDFQFTFHALAAHTAALLDAVGARDVTVVGHSMGGMLATRFALMFPERTVGLVLVNPIGLEDWQRKVPYSTIDAWYARELKKTPDAIRDYMKASYFDGQWKPEYDVLAELQAGWTGGPDYDQIAWVSALAFDMIFTQPVLYEFDRLRVATLLIIGDRDRTALGKNLVAPEVAATMGQYGELAHRTRDAIEGAELVLLPGVGHIPQYEAWDAYIGALTGFLAR